MDNKRIKIVYMSFSGNVRSFTHRLQEYATQQHHLNNENPLIDLLEISEETLPTESDSKFFVLLPTYMIGGSRFTPTLTEILTTPMHDYLESYDVVRLKSTTIHKQKRLQIFSFAVSFVSSCGFFSF